MSPNGDRAQRFELCWVFLPVELEKQGRVSGPKIRVVKADGYDSRVGMWLGRKLAWILKSPRR
jgi:hypothetical protein